MVAALDRGYFQDLNRFEGLGDVSSLMSWETIFVPARELF